MMLERGQDMQHGDREQDIAQGVVSRAQKVEGGFIFADQVRPGE
jgi:hypothetical protein